MVRKLSRPDYTTIIKLIKEGCYEECCQFVNEKGLYPIQEHSLKCLVVCVQYLKKEFSSTSLVKFINCLEFTEDIKNSDLKNYLLSVFHIVHFLIDKDDWSNIHSILHLIHPISTKTKEEDMKLYIGIRSNLLKALNTPNTQVTDETIDKILEFSICLEETSEKPDFLKFFFKLISTIPTQSIRLKIGTLAIDTIIRNNCNIFTKTNFKLLLSLLTKFFTSDTHEIISCTELKSCINKLKIYAKKKDDLQDVMDYFLATTTLFTTVDSIKFDDPQLFSEPITTINRAHKNASGSYLEDVVSFASHIQSRIKMADRQLIKKVKPIIYTKALNASLHAYISHAKSQAIILKRSDLLIKCCCSIRKNIIGAISIQRDAFEYATRVLSLVKDESTIISDIYKALQKLFMNTLELFDSLKEAKCKHLTTEWENLCRIVYSFCITMASAKRFNVNILFVEPLAKACFKYNENYYVVNEKCTVAVFYCLADCLVSFKRWNDAMDICALAIRLHKNHRASVSNIWNTIMYNIKGEETLCDIFERNSEYLRGICCDLKLKKLDKNAMAELYKYEVRNYVEKFKKWSRIEKCLELLFKVIDIDDYVDYLMTLPLDVLHYCNLKVLLSAESTPNGELRLSVYNYCLYKQHLRVARENFKELPKIGRIESVKSDEHEEDKQNELQYASNYSHICLKVHETFMTPLKDSLKYLSLIRGFKSEINPIFLDLAIQLGHEFELHCYDTNAHTSWSLAIHIANKTKDYAKYIYAATFLIKYEAESNHNLIPTCQKILESKKDVNIYTKFTFYTELATFYLKHDKLVDFRRCYQIAHEMFYDFGGSLYRDGKAERNEDKDLATAYFALMIGTMEMLPCREVVDEIHGCQTFQIPMHAWHLLLHYMNSAGFVKQTQLYTLFFKLGEHIVWKYYWSRMEREARQYCRTLTDFAENSICTFRVCRQLVYMGKLKIKEKQPEACQGIIFDLEVILKDVNCQEQQEDDICQRLESKLLIRDSSPVVLKQFKAPQFLEHEKCDCIPCTSREYQNILIEKYHLEAQVAEIYEDQKTLDKFLNGCFSLYRNLQRKTLLHADETYAELLWTKIRICRKQGDFNKLEKTMHILNGLLKQREYKNYYLYNDMKTLELMLLVDAVKTKTSNGVENEQNTQNVCKTPEFRERNMDGDSPTFHTPKSVKYMLDTINKPEEKSNFLEVPEIAPTRTRLRGKRILYTELQDSKASDKQATTSTQNAKTSSKIAVLKKSTRNNPRKTIR